MSSSNFNFVFQNQKIVLNYRTKEILTTLKIVMIYTTGTGSFVCNLSKSYHPLFKKKHVFIQNVYSKYL